MKHLAALTVLFLAASAAAVEIKPQGVPVTSGDDFTADSLLRQGDAEFQARDYAAALRTYLSAVDQARREFNRSVETEALAQTARMCLVQDRKEEGRPYLEQAAAIAVDSDPMGWSRYLGVRGRYQWQDSELAAARETFELMFDYCSVNALFGRAVDAAHMVAIVAASPEDQIAWNRRGIAAAEAADEERWLGPLWNNLGGTYWDNGQFDSALACYLKARDYHWRFSDETAKLFADYHVGMTYRHLGDYREAQQWLRPVLAWAERLDNREAIGQACEDLGEALLAEGKRAEGTALLRRARDAYRAAGYDRTRPEIWDNITRRLKELGE
ncbi:MAG TPA: tetratricopeptide repeat protein [candidate division Zixibacteria bacterium]|nr:tetratricopeptide repeat protein [candidate division Zixibacteria bacterium]